MRSVKNVQLHPGGGRHCRARVDHVMAALGGRRRALVIRFGNWFDLLTEEEVCFPCNLLQNRRALSLDFRRGGSSRDGSASGRTSLQGSSLREFIDDRTQSLTSQNDTLRLPPFC